MSSSTPNNGAGNTSFLLQLLESVSAIVVPVGGGLGLYAKWRRSAERDRRAREEAARVASERAASIARQEEQKLRDDLLKEKNDQIKRLAAENAALHKIIEHLAEGHHEQG